MMRFALLPFVASAWVAAAPAAAQLSAPDTRFITVSASADVEAAPDQAELRFDLVSENRDLTTAKTQNDQLVEKVLRVAREYNIGKDKTVTSNLLVQPEYDYKPENQRQLRGYRVSRSIQMTVTPLEAYEKVLAGLIAAGVDHVGGIQFTIANPESVEAQAREKAIAKARQKAESMTAALGVKLGRILSIQESGGMIPQPPMPLMRAEAKSMMMESAPDPMAGKVQVNQSVTLTYELQ